MIRRLSACRRALRRHGVLLLADLVRPNVAALVAGEPVRGSWWAHRDGRAIHAVASTLEEDPDVVVVKLLDGKLTFVERSLFPALLSVGLAPSAWKTAGLCPASISLLRRVRRAGLLRTDSIARNRWTFPQSVGRCATELTDRLLVHGRQVHTERGAHARQLSTWAAWRHERCRDVEPLPLAEARRLLEDVAHALPGHDDEPPRLPWQVRRR